MTTAITRQAKDVVYKVYKYFERRKNDRSTIEYANDINLAKTVSEATGFSVTSIKKIIKEARSMEAHGSAVTIKPPQKNIFPKKRIEMDSFKEGVIRRKITQWYKVKKCTPSLKKLNEQLKQDNVLDCSREYLRQTIRRLGFKYLTCQSKRKLLIERHDIMRLRWHYIRDIKNYRKGGKSIIFLGETYVTQKCWQANTERGAMENISKEPRIIIVHAGSRNGFVHNALLMFKSHSKTGDYHGDMNATNFRKWINEKLLPNIPPNSVIVMDNAAYNSTQINKKPTMSSLKSEMQQWLENQGVQHHSAMRKCDLMKIIDEQNTGKHYKIDEILNENGHIVLRLPPYHPDLNPIELVWGHVKGELERTTIDSNLDEKIKGLELLFSNYSPEKWKNCDEHVIKNEDEYYKSDRGFDDALDRFIIQVNQKDDEDDDDDDDDEQVESEHESDMEIDL
ncbi:uncharacterized protein LOC105389210 [Plutella xylostella]|uniref:uncharacterized protein LOC105389210 n=1 Tax=Plutella xylostella TaxID=51655 RepID=UPI002032291F|nr:uncharacterized protein LOC105389210 [Plutella xylostella]